MTREPNINHFFAVLEDEEFSVDKLVDENCNDDVLQEILWYLNKSRVEQICDEFIKKDDPHRGLIIKNLAQIYPLSRELLLQIFMDIKGTDYYFIKGFDINSNFLTCLKNILSDIENKIGRTTKNFQDYKKDIEKKTREAEDLRKDSEKFKELNEERNRLEIEIQRLKNETDEGELKKNIEDLEDQKRKLQNKLRQYEEDYRKNHDTINELKNELHAMENKMDSTEELTILRELLNKFPTDVEDPK